MFIPKRENGKYQLRTRCGRLLMVSQHREHLEEFRRPSHKVWQWFEGRYIAR